MNIEPKNHPIEKEHHLPNLHFLGSMLIFQGVSSLIPGKLTWQWKNPTIWRMYLLIKHGDVPASHVNFQGQITLDAWCNYMLAIIGFNRQPGLWSLAGWTTSGLLGGFSRVELGQETVDFFSEAPVNFVNYVVRKIHAYIHIYWFFLVAKKVDRCFFVFLGTCETCMATCHSQK